MTEKWSRFFYFGIQQAKGTYQRKLILDQNANELGQSPRNATRCKAVQGFGAYTVIEYDPQLVHHFD